MMEPSPTGGGVDAPGTVVKLCLMRLVAGLAMDCARTGRKSSASPIAYCGCHLDFAGCQRDRWVIYGSSQGLRLDF